MLESFIFIVAVLLIWNLIVLYQLKAQSKPNDNKQINDDIRESVSSLLKVVETTKIIEKLQFEESCKRQLIEEIKSLVFFGELKNPEMFYNRLIKRQEAFNAKTWNVQEHQAIVKMYDELISYTKHHMKNDKTEKAD